MFLFLWNHWLTTVPLTPPSVLRMLEVMLLNLLRIPLALAAAIGADNHNRQRKVFRASHIKNKVPCSNPGENPSIPTDIFVPLSVSAAYPHMETIFSRHLIRLHGLHFRRVFECWQYCHATFRSNGWSNFNLGYSDTVTVSWLQYSSFSDANGQVLIKR